MSSELKRYPRAQNKNNHGQTGLGQGRDVPMPEKGQCLDTIDLTRLEACFRKWAQSAARKDVRLSRRRMLIVFLIIRYTGAKLNEVLDLNPFTEIDFEKNSIFFKGSGAHHLSRQVSVSTLLAREIQQALADSEFKNFLSRGFGVDAGFVRRKFYERAVECGFSRRLAGPEMIRRARAVELMQSSLPLQVVQMMLGHFAPALRSTNVAFSENDIQQVMHAFMQREAIRKTSARNAFFGKVDIIEQGDIQARVEIITIGGQRITTVITNCSLDRLGLQQGGLITAEVKAPWVILEKGKEEPQCSAENRLNGIIEDMQTGRVNTEYSVRIADGTVLSAVVSSQNARSLDLVTGEQVWAVFNCFAVTLHMG